MKSTSRSEALLAADIDSGRLAESYLFLGLPEAGRRKAAVQFAKAINCEGSLSKSEPCDECSSCRKADASVHPDIFVLDFDSQAKLLELDDDDVRKQKELHIESVRHLIHQSQVTPLEGRKKILIIDGAELLSLSAANALLKSLEESTASAHWILLATGVERVLPTIQSRCRKVSFEPADAAAPPPDPAVIRILDYCARRAPGLDPVALSQTVFAEKKKGNARVRAEEILKQMALGLTQEMRENPGISFALMLEQVFEAQEDVRRNVSPQLVMDSLLYSLKSDI